MQLSFQETLNLKTETLSDGANSFFSSNIFEQRVTYFNGVVKQNDPYDYYLISKEDLLKLIQNKNQYSTNKENTKIHLNQPLPSRQRSTK
ncbi:hypothetical protein pb186bvf_004454 [Paramecium bursaria]